MITVRQCKEEIAYYYWLNDGEPYGKDKIHWEWACKTDVWIKDQTSPVGYTCGKLSDFNDNDLLKQDVNITSLQICFVAQKASIKEIIDECDREVFSELKNAI